MENLIYLTYGGTLVAIIFATWGICGTVEKCKDEIIKKLEEKRR